MKFLHKNVLITGGSSGIGLSTAIEFLNDGASVWITGRSSETLEKAEKEVNNSRLQTIISDTSKLTDIDNLVIHLSKQNIKLDALIINAGMGIFSPIQTMTEADFDNQISTNLKGSFFTLQKLIPHLEDGASVVFTSSTAATANIIGSSIYAATKTAINKIAKIAANELADRKIRVNIISPGPIATPGFETAVSKEEKEHLAKGIALKRLGKPYEIAKTILFLCSDDASFITGTEILVDGGFINYSMK